jgi:hypothetical protein
MESIFAVEREVNNVLDKLTHLSAWEAGERMTEAVDNLQSARQAYLQAGADNVAAKVRLMEAVAAAKTSVAKLSAAHRELHSSVSKVKKGLFHLLNPACQCELFSSF